MDEREPVNPPDTFDQIEDEHDPPGEDQGIHARFSIRQVAEAFNVAPDRVVRAFSGEYSLGEEASVDSRQAQHLAEVILGDRRQEERDAALMQLGAYTPRRDTLEPSVWEKPPGSDDDDTLLARDSVRRSDRLDDSD